MIANEDNEISSDDASKLIGCINAMSKQVLGDEGLIRESDPHPMKRAVAFCQSIKVSKRTTYTFNKTADLYLDSELVEDRSKMVMPAAKHIDGSMSAPTRDELLSWLKSENTEGESECRVLTNVRCLSEGVDVPSLDAVLFLSAKNSQVDVVQSVGRVMRKYPGKKSGYIIIPVVVPSNVEPSRVVDDNKRFKVIWTVLNALRAHDDRFNVTLNKLDLNKKKPDQILVGGITHGDGESTDRPKNPAVAQQLQMQFSTLQEIMYAKMVKKVGDRVYWEKWAKDVATIAENQIVRIDSLVAKGKEHEKAFESFLAGLQKNINPSISKEQAVEMLAQHLITKPVFEALFEGYSFVENNAVSKVMQAMIDILETTEISQDTKTLDKFYESVKKRAAGIDNAAGKQRIIIELYDKFFKTAFPRMVEQLGIVYTPIEVVDFVLYSVNELLKQEFGCTLSDEQVHILDPFTGTGTFMTRLLQIGLIEAKDLHRKYTQELHANELVLLAYYIAAVNIENAYHEALETEAPSEKPDAIFQPFDGIVFTDTFQLTETDGSDQLFSELFPQNSERARQQKETSIQVIIGNPPYSVGQRSMNDNAQNQTYERLEQRIAETYVRQSNAIGKRALYDAYLKAFRWSSDRLDPQKGGIIAFVSNGAWIDGNSTSGFRKTISQEFNAIYVFNLRGNQRTSGELARKEGGKIFGSGSRTPIAITLLVKRPNDSGKAQIYYHDIGDYRSRKDKLRILSNSRHIKNLPLIGLKPNKEGDWINQRNPLFDTFIPIEPQKKKDLKTQSYFNTYAVGIKTNRDAWVYNFSKAQLEANMRGMIGVYNQETEAYQKALQENKNLEIEDFVNTDSTKISWTSNLKKDLAKDKIHAFEPAKITENLYRPFCKQQLYFHKPFIENPSLNASLFPYEGIENFVIIVNGIGTNKEFSALITSAPADLQVLANAQCFPLYYYEKHSASEEALFDSPVAAYTRKEGISDFILQSAVGKYGSSVTKEAIFYYVYGILHSPDYRSTFANDFKRRLPRIPLVDRAVDFWAFSKAGRQLADWHIHYEKGAPYEGLVLLYDSAPESEAGADLSPIDYQVRKMRFGKKTLAEKTVVDKSTLIYNRRITLTGIPEKAYAYIVNGKSAIEWVMERYQVKTDKKSQLHNDPNHWAAERKEPRYILDLLRSVIRVSVQTVELVERLPRLQWDGKK